MTLLLILLVMYFVPSLIASQRRHANAGAIFVLNVFLGWTFLGWVVALVWACTNNVRTRLAPISKPYGRNTGMYIEKPVSGRAQYRIPRQFSDETDAEYAARLRQMG